MLDNKWRGPPLQNESDGVISMKKAMEIVQKLMPPPATPTAVPSESDWTQCEREFTVLPDDYKAFIAAYGFGVIDGWIGVYNFGQDLGKPTNFISEVGKILFELEDILEEDPDGISGTCFPVPGGYLPFGSNDNGDYLCWVTKGNPNDWTVAVIYPRDDEVCRFNGGMLQFLAETLNSEARWGPYEYETRDGPPVSFQSY